MTLVITYGIGGYDPTKPNNNIVEERVVPDDDEQSSTVDLPEKP